MSKQNKQNRFIKDSLDRVYDVTEKLHAQGITVLEIKVDESRPCIVVQDSPQCRKMTAVTQMRSFDGRVRKMRKVTVMAGCRIQWDQVEEAMPCCY